MILNERNTRHEQVLQIGKQMMIAARTAPKAKGVDIIEVALITDEDIHRLSEEMRAVCEENGFKFFLRDADNIMQAECVLLIGTHELPHGLNCGHCGFPTCAERPAGVPCAIVSTDVGIAIGSASHVIGTSKAMEMGQTEGAMSSLAIVTSGVLTVIAASLFAQLVDQFVFDY